MTYVALSRCKTHKGLYLLNFCPSAVKASKKACVEYSRLACRSDMLFNKIEKSAYSERAWYFNQAQQHAAATIVTEIKKVKNKRKAAVDKNSDVPPEKQKKKAPKQPNKAPSVKRNVKSARQRKKRVSAPKNLPQLLNSPMLETNGVEITGSEQGQQVQSNKQQPQQNQQTFETLGYEITAAQERQFFFNYNPVGEEWQRSICNAFGWPFSRCSRPPYVLPEQHVYHKRGPKFHIRVGSDGNCWYRTISHIVTGDENNYNLIKQSILDFIRHNIEFLHDYFLGDNTRIRELIPVDKRRAGFTYADYDYHRAAIDYLEYHSIPNTWNDEVITDFTSIVLKTPNYTYTTEIGWKTVTEEYNRDWSDVWKFHDRMTHIVELPNTTNQAMYILNIDNKHYEPARCGLIPHNEP